MDFHANSASTLVAALKLAQPGDVVRLAAGSYGMVKIDGPHFTGHVTITSADLAAPAVINYLDVRNASGLTFTGLDIEARPGAVGSQVSNSSDILFDAVHFHGQLDGSVLTDGSGITVRDSSNVTITRSEFEELRGAVTHINADGLTLTSNLVHDIRSDGFMGTGSDNLLISGNTFTDFHPSGGVHPDAIQLWTLPDAPTKNITITDNTITRGDGGISQGIFIVKGGGLGYENVTISGNALVGTMFHGITLNHATGAVVSNNLVMGYKDMVSRITIQSSTNVVESGNQATAYVISGNTNHTDVNNQTIVQAVVGDRLGLDAWLVNKVTQVALPPPPVQLPVQLPVQGGGFELPDLGFGGQGQGNLGQMGGIPMTTPDAPPQQVADLHLFSVPLFGGWLFL